MVLLAKSLATSLAQLHFQGCWHKMTITGGLEEYARFNLPFTPEVGQLKGDLYNSHSLVQKHPTMPL